jgi:hypothetical protein
MSKLRWSKTHDAIELAVIDHNVYDYFVEQLNNRALNQYTVSDLGYASLSQKLQQRFNLAPNRSSVSDLGYTSLSQELQQRFKKVQSFLQSRLHLTEFDFDLDTSSQKDLNYLHRQWVKLHQKYPSIATVFDQVLPGELHAINTLIHVIEESLKGFEIKTANPNCMIPNPFGTDMLGFGTYNITIAFNNLGRATYHKWLWDDRLIDTDTNNFDELYTTLELNVTRTMTRSAPEEYRAWCDAYGMPCVGSQMPLANFNKLDDNLLQYRQLFFKNILIQDNFITLE